MQKLESERTPSEGAPPRWHIAVNVPAMMLWTVGLPLLVCHLLSLSAWWAWVLVPAWSLVTGRIIDRYLPALTGPLLDRLHRASRRRGGRGG
ncbi:hypothetical protein [Nannocystis sp. SCPEA4]|uniref:hypothetical protein n=1 Tax=Nannocystis sp. SCPEA4 TaxID=2996787 RepID=UPI0022713589|nr:hypothetical protein [Nannocystis sp. SCPEA4]MCY1053458.1 hypothetical protein [Nannocystis sp. SCPEA4]